MLSSYKFVIRPSGSKHGHPFLIYDCNEQLHYELTRFAKVVPISLEIGTIKNYLYALLPFFSWLDTDRQQLKNGRQWQESPEKIRLAVEDYLVQQMKCQMQEHRLGFQIIRPTAKSPSQIHMFMVALKCFYKLMIRQGYYAYPNTLVDSLAEVLATVEEYTEDASHYPSMPDVSGVQEPRSRKRLTDSYYKLVGDEWIPKIIDDPSLPTQILKGGRQLKKWGLREECVTRMLFESGARISEVVALTLGDWVALDMKQEAQTFSKRSKGRRVKFIRFSSDTAKLLRRYFNTERIKYDPNSYSLDNYLGLVKHQQLDLLKVPLFLTAQERPLTPKNYRDNYWRLACEAAGIDANLHQARHWYVTMAIRQIYETSTTDGEVERRKRALKTYMKWESQETINAYDHYFDSLQHAEIQDRIHGRIDIELKERLEKRQQAYCQPLKLRPTEALENTSKSLPEDDEFDYLCRIGRSHHVV